MSRSSLALAICLVLFPVGLVVRDAADVEAATVLALRIEDLAARCDLAIEARVTSRSATRDAAGCIGTDYALDVQRTFAGAPAVHCTVRMPGGVLPDGRGMVIAGMPVLETGEQVILFLSCANVRGERLPIGLAQGRLRVVIAPDGTPGIVSDVAGLTLVDPSGHAQPAPGSATLPYAATIQRIVAACALRPATPAGARSGGRGGHR
jgi:hypothetical protein